MISGRLPQDAESWPPGLLEHLASFAQGHLVRGLPFFYFGDPSCPVLTGTQEPDAEPLFWHEHDFEYGLIVTQTCDLQEAGATRPRKPWVHCCPVYRADDPSSGISEGLLGQARKGQVDYLLEVPAIEQEGVWVADLRLLIPVEKSFLLAKEPIEGFYDERARRAVGERIALVHSRPAFDDKFIALVMTPLLQRLASLAKQDPDLFAEVSARVYALAVRSDRLVEMALESVEIFLLCHEEPSESAREFWEAESETWSQDALRSTSSRLQSLRIVELGAISAREFLEMQVVPLRGMTPHPLWHVD